MLNDFRKQKLVKPNYTLHTTEDIHSELEYLSGMPSWCLRKLIGLECRFSPSPTNKEYRRERKLCDGQ